MELTQEQHEQVMIFGSDSVVDGALAARDAAELYSVGELKMGTDESLFLTLITTRNIHQLRATFTAYHKVLECVVGHTCLV